MNNNDIVQLQNEKDFLKYINILSKIKYEITIIIAVRDIIGQFLGEDGRNALSSLGLTEIDICPNPDWRPYVAVIKNGQVIIETIGDLHTSINEKVWIKDKGVDVFSAPLYTGNTASILVGNDEYCTNERGFNFVVMNEDGEIIDSVAFDTHQKERFCLRKLNERKTIVLGHQKDVLKNRSTGFIRQRLAIKNILGANVFLLQQEKIKIRFFVWGAYGMWNTVDSVVRTFVNDERFDCLVVLQCEHIELIRAAILTGAEIVFDRDYKINQDKPDIAYFNKARDYYKDFPSIKYKLNVEAGLINGFARDNNILTLINDICNKEIDAILVEKHIYEVINQSGYNADKIWHAFGNPKFDVIYQGKELLSHLPKSWEKIKDRRVIVWCCDHNWNLNDFSFDLYIKDFIDYFKKNDDLALIIRPHMMVEIELKRNRIWTEDDAKNLKIYINNTPNIVWDDMPDYRLALNIADGLITDINCGITLSAMVIDKPIAVTYRYDGNECEPLYPQISECHYQIHSKDELFDFFDMVRHNEDPLKKKRNAIKDKYICHFDGKNGQRIKDFIVKKYNEKVAQEIAKKI